MIERDNKIFFNTNDFADLHSVNGVQVAIVEDNDKLSEKITKDYDGLIIGDILFYIADIDMRKIKRINYPPRVGDVLIYDDEEMEITSVINQDGQWELILIYQGARNEH